MLTSLAKRVAGGAVRVVALDQLVEELGPAAEVVLDAELLDVGPVHEDDLGLDRELRGADVEPAHEVGDAGDAAPGVGQDQGVRAGVGHDPAAVLGQDALDRLGERAGLGVVDPDDAGLQRLERVERGERRRRVHPDDPAGHLLGREALGGENRLERLRPRLVLDLGVDLALHVLAEDDGAPAEGGEPGDHVGDAGAIPGDGDPRLVGAGQHGCAPDAHFRLRATGPGRSRGRTSAASASRRRRQRPARRRHRWTTRPGTPGRDPKLTRMAPAARSTL